MKMESGVEPFNIYHQVCHVPQAFKWDCGIACIAMITADHSTGQIHPNFYKVVKQLKNDSRDGFGTRYDSAFLAS